MKNGSKRAACKPGHRHPCCNLNFDDSILCRTIPNRQKWPPRLSQPPSADRYPLEHCHTSVICPPPQPPSRNPTVRRPESQ
ncbi:hypothetical protein L1987_34238 [Smallanthus sonchifolius]|uniref:Uncharacterized protein n=1 Tax=Smallanthus sonchifolius TaxID=185202 RepID=A0ACB9HTZ6_9ASTR|nr:hypothetical protein L1987_34238 [Smallanthus sonchifolius]